MLEVIPGVTLYARDGQLALHTATALQCGHCREMHHFWRNLCGRTVCLNCVDPVEREWIERAGA